MNNRMITTYGGISVDEITLFKTVYSTTTTAEDVIIPLFVGEIYDFRYRVDGGSWVNHSLDTLTINIPTAGDHTIDFDHKDGGLPAWRQNNSGDKTKIKDVTQWGSNVWAEDGLLKGFHGCSNLIVTATDTPDLSVTESLRDIFRGCTSLTVDVSSWDVSLITSLYGMFNGCTSTIVLDVSLWDVSNVTILREMFANCQSVLVLDVSSWTTTSLAGTMYRAFYKCQSVTSFDISSWDTSGVTTFTGMFQLCSSVISINVTGISTAVLGSTARMFSGCGLLTTVDVSGFSMSSVNSIESMFEGCSSLTSIDVSTWVTTSLLNIDAAFSACTNLTTLDVSSWDVSLLTTAQQAFKDCTSLTTLDISTWDVSSVTVGSLLLVSNSLTTVVYDAFLINADSLTVQSGVDWGFGNSVYTLGGAAETARTNLITNDSWVITDGGGI